MVKNNSITESLIITITVLTCELCFAPRTNSQVMPTITITAGIFIKPPSTPGGFISWAGKIKPKEVNILTIYPDQPTATAATITKYSNIRSHPIIHANSSPKVT